MPGRRLIFRTFQSPGDVLMLTAAVRDLHMAAPGSFQTDIRTSADALWENNPLITRLNEHEAGVETIECHYPLVHQANARPYHFIHGYAQFLEQRLGVPIPLTRFSGDVYLSAEEKQRPLPFAELGLKEGFWIVIAGGKYDFTAKWWDPAGYQAVVDHFQARIQFAQCGESGHWHPRLKNAVDLVGRTSLRDFVVLMHHAAGVLCPVTFAMHLAATVETRPGRPRRPCVVVAGAREPAHWEQYPGHQFLHTVGSLPCCARDPCWRSRCQLVGDGDEKDRKDVCERPVQLTPELRIAQCMAMISPDDVIRAIERYVGQASVGNGLRAVPPPEAPNGRARDAEKEGPSDGAMETSVGNGLRAVPPPEAPNGRARDAEKEGPSDGAMETSVGNGLRAVPPPDNPKSKVENPKLPVLLDFRHGLGDAVQLTTVLSHLRHYHPDWQIDVAAGIGKLPGVVSGQWPVVSEGSAEGKSDGERPELSRVPLPGEPELSRASLPLYDRLIVRERESIDRGSYKHVFDLAWEECPAVYADSPSTKAEHCLKTVFQLRPIAELCRYVLTVGDRAWAAAKNYLASVCPADSARDGRYPVVLMHYQGNTSSEKKDLPHELAERVCQIAIEAGHVPVILDWDKRTPLADGVRIHNPGADAPLWGASGTGDCEVLAALIAQSSLFIGVDSGPLHVAGAVVSGPWPVVSGQTERTRERGTEGQREGGTERKRDREKQGRGEGGSDDNLSTTAATPAIAVWTGHHPLRYFGLAEHVTHLVPEDHAARLPGDRQAGLAFFQDRYRRRVYRQLATDLPALVKSMLTAEDFEQAANKEFLRRLSATGYGEQYYLEHKLAGLDYLGFGEWQQQYGRWLVGSLELKGKRLLDVGCACGSILRGFGQAGAIAQGVDLCEAMVRRGRQQWPDMEALLHVCDAVNLHLFGDASWDALHTAQVAEHWKPDLVPFILRELARVVVPGGLLFCALDTEELFARQGRRIEHEDPTHVCIRPMSWWHERLAENGWRVCTAEYEPALRSHADSFLARYDWDWFIATKDEG